MNHIQNWILKLIMELRYVTPYKVVVRILLILISCYSCQRDDTQHYSQSIFLKFNEDNRNYLIYYYDVDFYFKNNGNKILKLSFGDLIYLHDKENKNILFSKYLYNIFNENDFIEYDKNSINFDAFFYQKIKHLQNEKLIQFHNENINTLNINKKYTLYYLMLKNDLIFNNHSKKIEKITDILMQ